jgi:cardiolipin synthase
MPVAPLLRQLTAGMLVMLISACGTQPSSEREGDAGSKAGSLQPVEAPAGAAAGLIAESAYLAGAQFYIRYRQGSELKYATGIRRMDAVPPQTSGELLAHEDPGGLTLEVCLVPLQETSWHERAAAAREPLHILPSRHWEVAFDLLRKNLTPRKANTGAVIDILELEEWVSYYDDTGIMQWILIQDKPPGVHVKYSYRFEQVLEMFLPVLENHLNTAGIASREVLLNTGDAGPDSTPFVYANLDDGVVLFLTSRSDTVSANSTKAGMAHVRATTHVIIDQLRSLVERPMTSIGRLFAQTGTAVMDGFNRTVIVPGPADYIPPLSEGPGMDLQAWERQLDEITGTPVSMGRISYLVDGVEFFPRLIDVIQSARESIDIRMYIFDDDDYAIKMADILKARSRDVEVRVLVDGLGTTGAATQESASLPNHHKAPLSIFNYLEKDSSIDVRRSSNFWLGGDHAKSIIVDEDIGFVGGMNIGREYRYDWHDLMVELKGPVVDILRDEFDKAWAHEQFFGDLQLMMRESTSGSREAQEGDYPIRVLFTRAADSQIYLTQLQAIRNARRYIFIENAYFTDDLILHELIMARMRGVDVRVIVPFRSDFGLMKRNNALVANAMLENGIRVYIYPGMSHVKAAVYDGWICLGSANLDRLSLRVNKEINIATTHGEAVQALMERVFIPDMQSSVELREPFPENWLDFLAEIMADHL